MSAAGVLFCVRCQRRIDFENDLGAVELQGNQGAMCGADVDRLIAEIAPSRDSEMFGHHGMNRNFFSGKRGEAWWL